MTGDIGKKMYVIKRDGRQEEVSFDKVLHRIQKLAVGKTTKLKLWRVRVVFVKTLHLFGVGTNGGVTWCCKLNQTLLTKPLRN